MPSKDREYAGLRAVYRENEFDVVAGENPDFVLSRSAISFGVEVTEVFESDSMARARTHPAYIGDLLAGGRTLHPDDADEFKVVEGELTDAEGHVKNKALPAIMRPISSLEQHLAHIVRTISRKEKRFDDYIAGLQHVNLIVVDDIDSNWSSSEETDTGALLQPDLRRLLRRTSFREIYLVTRTRSLGGISVPLRMLFLVGELYAFVQTLGEFNANEEFDEDNILPQFARYELDAGCRVTLGKLNEELHVGLGNCSIAFRPGESLPIFDHADRNMPLDPVLIPQPFEPTGEFARQFADIWADHHFGSQICIPVHTVPFWWPRPATDSPAIGST